MFENNCIFFRTSFSSKCSAGHVECSFDNPAEKFLTKLKYFRWMSENDMKIVSSRNLFFLKVVIWTLRMQFWKPRRKSFDNKPETTRSVSQMILEKYFFSKNLILKLFLWTRFMQLWPPFRKLSHKNPKVFLSISENDINYIFFKLNFLSSKLFLQTRIVQFWQPCQKIVPEARKFCAQFPKKKKNNLPQQKSFKMLSWMRWMQFWQPCRKIFDKKPNYFRWMSENDIKNNSLEICFFLITSLWTRIMQLWQPCQKNCARSPKFFRSISEKD